jgi:hypothetical protein
VEHIKGVVCKIAHEKGIDLSLSRQKQRRVESIELVRSERDGNRAPLAFHSRPFVLCGLPIRRPPAGTSHYTRRNGRFKLDIIAHPEFGLPFGQDRLIPIWVATLAVKQKSRTVIFRSAAEILEHFDLPKDGPHYRRLVDGFKRIFASSVFFGTDEAGESRQAVWDYRRFHFFDRLRLWCNPEPEHHPDGTDPSANVICLSEAFWQEIQAHPIPVNSNVVRALTGNPGCLDFYMWLSWRCFHAKRSERIPLFGPGGLVNQLGVMEYSRDRNFRKRIREWFKLVALFWPDCPAQLDHEGRAIVVAPDRRMFSEESNVP